MMAGNIADGSPTSQTPSERPHNKCMIRTATLLSTVRTQAVWCLVLRCVASEELPECLSGKKVKNKNLLLHDIEVSCAPQRTLLIIRFSVFLFLSFCI